MKIALRMAGLAVLGGLGIWLWLGLFPSPEQAVRKQVAALAATATLRPDDGAITRAGKVSSLIGFFATNADISYDLPGVGAGALAGRDEIREAAVGGLPRRCDGALNVEFLDATVRVGRGPPERRRELHRAGERRRQPGLRHSGNALPIPKS